MQCQAPRFGRPRLLIQNLRSQVSGEKGKKGKLGRSGKDGVYIDFRGLGTVRNNACVRKLWGVEKPYFLPSIDPIKNLNEYLIAHTTQNISTYVCALRFFRMGAWLLPPGKTKLIQLLIGIFCQNIIPKCARLAVVRLKH